MLQDNGRMPIVELAATCLLGGPLQIIANVADGSELAFLTQATGLLFYTRKRTNCPARALYVPLDLAFKRLQF